MGQTTTGKLTEKRVTDKLISLGLVAYKPIPDEGIDIITHLPGKPDNRIKIQVKGRNPKNDPNLRWFQIRVRKDELLKAKRDGLKADQTWINNVNKVDFFILDAVKVNEMWVFSRDDTFELIRLNESKYKTRLDNTFNYNEPLKVKQKEMNLDIDVDGVSLTSIFKKNRDNFQPILERLGMKA